MLGSVPFSRSSMKYWGIIKALTNHRFWKLFCLHRLYVYYSLAPQFWSLFLRSTGLRPLEFILGWIMLCLLNLGRFRCFGLLYFLWSLVYDMVNCCIVRVAILFSLILFLFLMCMLIVLFLCEMNYRMPQWLLLIVIIVLALLVGMLMLYNL